MALSKDPRARLRSWLLSGEPPRPRDAAEATQLAAAAASQGLVGLLRAAVEQDATGWPEDVRAALRDAHRAAWANGVRRLLTAGGVQERLRGAGLRALPLKGAALAERLYDSVADRPMVDVDLLALDGWQESVAVLRSAGFEEREHADHAWAFADPETDVIVELHHGLTSCPGLFPVDEAGLWQRSRASGGQVPRVPSDEDLLVQLSLHAAFQHGLVLSLVQWLDFRRLLERGAIEVPLVLELAGRARARAAVAAALDAAGAVVAAPVPVALRDSLAPHVPRRFARWLGAHVAGPLECVAPAEPRFARLRWALAAGQRRRLVGRTLLPKLPGSPESARCSAWRAALRIGGLLHRWGRPSAWGHRRPARGERSVV